MRTRVKDVGFAAFFLIVIALVAVEAAEDATQGGQRTAASIESAD